MCGEMSLTKASTHSGRVTPRTSDILESVRSLNPDLTTTTAPDWGEDRTYMISLSHGTTSMGLRPLYWAMSLMYWPWDLHHFIKSKTFLSCFVSC